MGNRLSTRGYWAPGRMGVSLGARGYVSAKDEPPPSTFDLTVMIPVYSFGEAIPVTLSDG